MYDSDTDSDALGLIETISLSEAGQPYSWIKIFPEGSRKHPKGTLNFNQKFHKTIVRSVNEQFRGIPPYVDTDHDSGISNGWISEARHIKGHGTDIKVDWTPLGAERVEKKLYRFVSPEFGPFLNERTGEKVELTLNAASLTNRPFLKDLGEVTLTRLNELGAFEFADGPPPRPARPKTGPKGQNPGDDDEDGDDDSKEVATKANPDPDNDGDDDSTAAGDTDHSHTGPDGHRVPRKKLSDTYSLNAEHISQADRDATPSGDFAGPHQSYPVRNQHEAKAAWDLAGHADDPAAVRARIKAIAKRKGFSLPSTAQESGKMSDPADNDTDDSAVDSTAPSRVRGNPPAAGNSTHSLNQAKESNTMPENATPTGEAVDMTALTEAAKQATAMLGEARTAMTTMREENEKIRRELTETKLDHAFVALSESRRVEIKADDGAVSTGMTKGFAAPVVTAAKALILDNISLREPIMDLLTLIQTTGMVPLSEIGTGSAGTDHDPFEPVSLSDDPTGSKKLAAAQTKAKTMNLNWASLSADEKIGIFALVEKN